MLGVGLAWLVGAHRFPGRRVLSWALVLPLAMPGYILGFVTTAVFGVAGPVQTWWRDQFGRDAWFPEIRSLPGAIVTLTLTLYPYVYLLARAALRDQAATAALVARTLGASRGEATRRVVAADAATGDRRRGGHRRHGDAHRLRHRAVLQPGDRHRRRVPHLARHATTATRPARSPRSCSCSPCSPSPSSASCAAGPASASRAARPPGSSRCRLRGWRAAAATLVATASSSRRLRRPDRCGSLTWAIDEQRSPRGTPMVERYVDFLGNSLTLTAVTVGICLLVSTIVANAHRFSPTRGRRRAPAG